MLIRGMDLPVPCETGKVLRDPATGQWLTASGRFVTDSDSAAVFESWNEAYSAACSASEPELELVLKLHGEYRVLQVFSRESFTHD